MLAFECDYNNGAHPKILENLLKTNDDLLPGYGEDIYCARAKEKIKQVIGKDGLEVYFLTGGTQTNQIVIDTMLANWEGVVCCSTGHINCHEAGAIEKVGKKCLAIPQHLGKIDPAECEAYLANFYADGNHEHMIFPGMVYISHPTEYGTLYTKAELTALHNICVKYNIPLFMDGARLGYGLMSNDTDVTIQDIAELTDVFYIGATKIGAYCGEAVVFTHNNTPKHFTTQIKQHGALNAKGRLLGVQFDTLFTDNLYFEISKHAINQAQKIRDIFVNKGFQLFIESPTNQQFVILTNEEVEQFAKEVRFSFWEPYDENHTVVRFASSWYTTDESLAQLDAIIPHR